MYKRRQIVQKSAHGKKMAALLRPGCIANEVCLFVLGVVKRVGGYFYIGLTLIPVAVQLVATAKNKCGNAKQLYIKQKAGRSHPAMGEVFVFVALNFLGHVSNFTRAKVRVGGKTGHVFTVQFVKKTCACEQNIATPRYPCNTPVIADTAPGTFRPPVTTSPRRRYAPVKQHASTLYCPATILSRPIRHPAQNAPVFSRGLHGPAGFLPA